MDQDDEHQQNNPMDKLTQQIEMLKEMLLSPQEIILQGIEHLPADLDNSDWRDKIFDLLYSARIPFFWIIDFKYSQSESGTIVTLSCINYLIKAQVVKMLNEFLQNEIGPAISIV